jgi:hypothetical protein
VVAFAKLIGHGGVPGAIAESLVALAVGGVLFAIWLRERRAGRDRSAKKGKRAASLRDHDDSRPS